MALVALAEELLIQVCGSLEQPDLRHVSLAGQRKLTVASDVSLYRHISVEDRSAIKLLRTFKDQPHLATLVHDLDYLIGDMLCRELEDDTPISESSVFETLAELLPMLCNLREIRLDTQMAPVLPFDLVFTPLCSLKTLTKAVIVGTPNTCPIDRLAPVLKACSPNLRSFECHGLTSWPLFASSLTLPPLPVLTELRLFSPRLKDSVLFALCEKASLRTLVLDMEDDDDAREDGSDGPGPTDQGILQVLERHGNTLRDLTIRRGWLGREGGDWRLGLGALQRCTRLERLELHGQISCREMMMRGSDFVRDLNMQFCSTLCYEDVTAAIKADRWPSLKNLDVHHTGYTEDYDLSTVEDLEKVAKRKRIHISAGAVLGPFNAPDPPSPVLDIDTMPVPLTPQTARTPKSSMWPMTPRTPHSARCTMII